MPQSQTIPQIPFPPLARTVPQIGFGCGRLVGRSTLRQSARLVETALELGIRYFDVAPIYGMGTAEEVLGEVLANSADVIVATKVGLPRPVYNERVNRLRRWGKPILDRARFLKTLARKVYARPQPVGTAPASRFVFTREAIEASLAESLEKLRRRRVDVFLAHDPDEGALGPDVAGHFEALVRSGMAGAVGIGVDRRCDRWPGAFGSVWQSGWPGGDALRGYAFAAPGAAQAVSYVFHGTIRYAEKSASGSTVVPAAQLVREACRLAPNSIILVSTSTPRQLRELLTG